MLVVLIIEVKVKVKVMIMCACAARAMKTRRSRQTLPRPDKLHHIVEDFLTSWTAPLSHVLPLQRFLGAVVGRDLRAYFAESCMIASLTHARLPSSCERQLDHRGERHHALQRPTTTAQAVA